VGLPLEPRINSYIGKNYQLKGKKATYFSKELALRYEFVESQYSSRAKKNKVSQ